MKVFETKLVLGLPIGMVSIVEAAECVIDWAQSGSRAYGIEAADVHVVTRARHESDFGECMRKFDLICPDGMPVVWAMNRRLLANEKLKERVSGAELMAETFAKTEGNDTTHFLLGGSESLLSTLESKLSENYPDAEVAGTYSPPFGEWPVDEFERICEKIKASGANLIWVGLGCPKQERWIGDNLENLPPGCYFGVGAAFAFHAGHIKRAPAIFQKTGMEWFYRLCKEPRRLWKRYFTYNALFLYYSFLQR